MASNCIYCGAALEDGATFCKSCGKPASLFTPTPEPQNTQTSGDMPAAESYQEQPQQQVQQPYGGYYNGQPYGGAYGGQQYTPPAGYGSYQNQNAYNQSMNVYNQSQYMGLNETPFSPYSQGEQPVSVGQWMLTTILFAIPLVGTIYLIILAVGGPSIKKSLTNFARAAFIWAVLALAAYVVLFLALGFTLKNSGFIKLFM